MIELSLREPLDVVYYTCDSDAMHTGDSSSTETAGYELPELVKFELKMLELEMLLRQRQFRLEMAASF